MSGFLGSGLVGRQQFAWSQLGLFHKLRPCAKSKQVSSRYEDFVNPDSELMHCHSHLIVLIKVRHTSCPDSREGKWSLLEGGGEKQSMWRDKREERCVQTVYVFYPYLIHTDKIIRREGG